MNILRGREGGGELYSHDGVAGGEGKNLAGRVGVAVLGV